MVPTTYRGVRDTDASTQATSSNSPKPDKVHALNLINIKYTNIYIQIGNESKKFNCVEILLKDFIFSLEPPMN